MALFTTELGERRNAFVRVRFAEQQVFGFADIEEWLKSQKEAERPDMPRWAKFIERFTTKIQVGSQLACLSGATPISPMHLEKISSGSYEQILNLLSKGKLYWGLHEGILKPDEMSNSFFAITEVDNKLVIERVGNHRSQEENAQILLWILLEEWNMQRPKSNIARNSLWHELKNVIQIERHEAEIDFNNAVATSEDGTMIVRADWIVIVDDERTVLFPYLTFSDSFLGEKAKLGIESGYRFSIRNLGNNSRSVRTYLETDNHIHSKCFMQSPASYQVFDCGPCGDKSFKMLFIKRDFCPSPLPSGGIEVT